MEPVETGNLPERVDPRSDNANIFGNGKSSTGTTSIWDLDFRGRVGGSRLGPVFRKRYRPLEANRMLARHTGRNWALLGENAPLTLIPYQNRIMAPQAG